MVQVHPDVKIQGDISAVTDNAEKRNKRSMYSNRKKNSITFDLNKKFKRIGHIVTCPNYFWNLQCNSILLGDDEYVL